MDADRHFCQAGTGVNVFERWNRSKFRSDFRAESEGPVEGSGPEPGGEGEGDAERAVGESSRRRGEGEARPSSPRRVLARSKLGSRDRVEGTNSERCRFGLVPSRPYLRASGEGGVGSRKTDARMAARPSTELRDDGGGRTRTPSSVLEGVEEPEVDVRRRSDVRRSHCTMLFE